MRSSDLKFGLIFLVLSLAVKIPYLGTFLTIDERRWIHGAGDFLLALHSGNLAETYWHFHPGITITWGEAITLWLQSLWATNSTLEEFVQFQMNNLSLSVGAMRLSGIVLTSLALPFVYAFARPFMSRWAAILGVGLLAVDPFWVAHSRIVNGDALAGVLMVASYLAFALLLIKPDQKLAIISGVFVGLSFLTKLPSQILVFCIILLAAIGYYRDKNWRFWLQALIWSGLSSAIVFIILWPAMWVAPLQTLTLMYEDTFTIGDIGGKDKVEFFMGQVVEIQSNFFYPVALLFRTTPFNLIGAGLALILIFVPKQKPRLISILLWLFVILVIVLANFSPKKADRYAMSAIVAVNLLAGLGWVWLIKQLQSWLSTTYLDKFTQQHRALNIYSFVTIILVAGQLVFVLINYPYVLTHYNPLLGGFAKAAEMVPVGRGEGLEQAAAWINSQPDGQQATITPYYENVTNHYLAGTSLDWPKDGKKQILADYVIFYITQTQRQLPYPGLVDYFQTKTPAYVVRYGETPYVWVYKREHPIQPLEGEAQIVGRAQIVGYYQANSNLEPGGSTEIILYFLTQDQPLPDNEDFKVSLLSGDNNSHGDWQTAASNKWLPNAIVEWQGQLSVPNTLPPSDYKLKVSLMDTNVDSEITFFPFEEEIIVIQPQTGIVSKNGKNE